MIHEHATQMENLLAKNKRAHEVALDEVRHALRETDWKYVGESNTPSGKKVSYFQQGEEVIGIAAWSVPA